MRLVFIGPPGAGKGTQAKWLTGHLSIPHLSTGEMLREVMAEGGDLGQAAQKFVSDGKLVPDDLVIQIVNDRLQDEDCRAGFLLDGFPRTLAQAKALQQLLEARNEPLDFVISLSVPDETLLERMLQRGREDDSVVVIKKRFDVFHAETKPLLEHYNNSGLLHTLDGTGSPDEVRQRILQLLEQPGPAAD